MYKVVDLIEDERTTVESTLNEWEADGYEPFQVIRRATYSWRLIFRKQADDGQAGSEPGGTDGN